ncbi:hypothetical protein [uncultured Cyclobacterium sp.]|uniref:hypothetical protein n=1 Tax=uncultured Cyclobacterium sp. TaxID=453820 RepID=UPI0030EF55F9
MLKIYHSLSFFFLCWLFLVYNSNGQSLGDVWLSTGIQSMSSKDEGFSLLNYKGNKSTSSVGFVLRKKNKTHLIQGDFSYGVLANKPGGTMNEMGVNLTTLTFYHKLKTSSKGFQYGWANKNTMHIRRHNQFSNYSFRYDYFSGLGPVAKHLLPFEWKKKSFLWQNMANWQLLGIQVKSGYIGAEPENYQTDKSLTDNFFNTVSPFVPLRDLDLNFSSSLFWELPTGNKLGLRYQANYTKLSGIKSVYRLDHSVDLILNVRLW